MNAKEFKNLSEFVSDKLPHYLSDYVSICRASKKRYKIICDDKLQLLSDSKQINSILLIKTLSLVSLNIIYLLNVHQIQNT